MSLLQHYRNQSECKCPRKIQPFNVKVNPVLDHSSTLLSNPFTAIDLFNLMTFIQSVCQNEEILIVPPTCQINQMYVVRRLKKDYYQIVTKCLKSTITINRSLCTRYFIVVLFLHFARLRAGHLKICNSNLLYSQNRNPDYCLH